MPNPYETTAPSEGQKATKAEAHYGIAKAGSGDRCSSCQSFRPPNDCVKVEGRVAPAGWCSLGHSKADGHAFDEKAESPAQDAAETPAAEAAEQPKPAINAVALSHGRAIAGAKALHAVGHISAAERDRHMKASQKFISKRKAFGSWT